MSCASLFTKMHARVLPKCFACTRWKSYYKPLFNSVDISLIISYDEYLQTYIRDIFDIEYKINYEIVSVVGERKRREIFTRKFLKNYAGNNDMFSTVLCENFLEEKGGKKIWIDRKDLRIRDKRQSKGLRGNANYFGVIVEYGRSTRKSTKGKREGNFHSRSRIQGLE